MTPLPTMVQNALGAASLDGLLDAWRRREDEDGRPLVLILDQVEEILTRGDDNAELGELVDQLAALFGRRSDRPLGRVLLTLRSEWYAAPGPLKRRSMCRSPLSSWATWAARMCTRWCWVPSSGPPCGHATSSA
ncbi:MAG: hypothetical protein R3F60_13260 [bacterium]